MFSHSSRRFLASLRPSLRNCKTVLVAPGQGKFDTQSLTQLNEYYEQSDSLQELLERVDAALPIDIVQYIKDPTILNDNDAKDVFQKTSVQQPLLILSSLITNNVLQEKYKLDLFHNAETKADYSIGHSLGEITFLPLNGVINVEDSLNLAYSRGQYMEEIMLDIEDNAEYTMCVLMFQSQIFDRVLTNLQKYSKEGFINISNINNYQQIVISGKRGDIKKAVSELSGQLAKEKVWTTRVRAVDLGVEIPFHNPVLQSIEIDLVQIFGATVSNSVMCNDFPVLPISNLNGQVTKQVCDQINNIIQVTSRPVQFLKCLETASFEKDDDSIDTLRFINFGPGKVTQNLIDKFLVDIQKRNVTLPFSHIENLCLDSEKNIQEVVELYNK